MNQSIEQNAFVEQILTKRQHFFFRTINLDNWKNLTCPYHSIFLRVVYRIYSICESLECS